MPNLQIVVGGEPPAPFSAGLNWRRLGLAAGGVVIVMASLGVVAFAHFHHGAKPAKTPSSASPSPAAPAETTPQSPSAPSSPQTSANPANTNSQPASGPANSPPATPSSPTPPTTVPPLPATLPSLGIVTCCGADTTEESRLLTLGVKLIRMDRGDYELPFAHQHGMLVDGIIWLDTASAGMGADILELDNEPYFNNWDGMGGPQQWAQKARDVAKSIKASSSSKTILLPLYAQNNSNDTRVYTNGSWQPLVDVINQAAPDIWQYVDAFAIHPYSAPNPPNFSTMDHIRSQLKAIGSKADKPFWVTEVGWPTGGTSSNAAVSEADQALYLGQFIDQARARSDVAVVILFKISDGYSPALTESHYGLFHLDGSQKPSFSVVQSRL